MELLSAKIIPQDSYAYEILNIDLRIYPPSAVNPADTLEIYCFQGQFYKILHQVTETLLTNKYEIILPKTYHYVGNLEIMLRISGRGNIPTTSNRKAAYRGKRLLVAISVYI